MGLDVGFQGILAQSETFPWSNSGKNQEDIKTSNKLQPCGFREKQDTPTFLLWFPWQRQQQLYTTIALCFVCFCFFSPSGGQVNGNLLEEILQPTRWADIHKNERHKHSDLSHSSREGLGEMGNNPGQGNNVQIPPWQQWGILLRGSPLIWITWKNNKQPKQVES